MKIITASNQKGGVGKTTLLTLLANIFSQQPYNYSILIIDQDSQMSTYKRRQRDLKLYEEIPTYDVITLNLDDTTTFVKQTVLEVISGTVNKDEKDRAYFKTEFSRSVNLLEEKRINNTNQALYNYDPNKSIIDNYDFIFMDMPGTLASEESLKPILMVSDAILMPFKPSDKDIESTLDFIEVMLKIRAHRKKYDLEFPIFSYLNEHINTTDFKIAKKFNDLLIEKEITFSNVHLRRRNIYLRITTMMESFLSKAIKDCENDKNVAQSLEIKKFTKEIEEFLTKVAELPSVLDLINA